MVGDLVCENALHDPRSWSGWGEHMPFYFANIWSCNCFLVVRGGKIVIVHFPLVAVEISHRIGADLR
jgi:hypothetical protein